MNLNTDAETWTDHDGTARPIVGTRAQLARQVYDENERAGRTEMRYQAIYADFARAAFEWEEQRANDAGARVAALEADYAALAEECERYRQWWLDATQRAANADKARRHAEIRAFAWRVAAENIARQHHAQGGAE